MPAHAHTLKYATYIQSDAWRARRAAALVRAGHRCEWLDSAADGGQSGPGVRCPQRHGLHVHHLTYKRLGRERDADLQVLCPRHHAVAELLKVKCRTCGLRVVSGVNDADLAWRWASGHARLLTPWSRVLDSALAFLASGHRCHAICYRVAAGL